MNVKVICILKDDIIKGMIDDNTNDNNLLDKSIERIKRALERMTKLKNTTWSCNVLWIKEHIVKVLKYFRWQSC